MLLLFRDMGVLKIENTEEATELDRVSELICDSTQPVQNVDKNYPEGPFCKEVHDHKHL